MYTRSFLVGVLKHSLLHRSANFVPPAHWTRICQQVKTDSHKQCTNCQVILHAAMWTVTDRVDECSIYKPKLSFETFSLGLASILWSLWIHPLLIPRPGSARYKGEEELSRQEGKLPKNQSENLSVRTSAGNLFKFWCRTSTEYQVAVSD